MAMISIEAKDGMARAGTLKTRRGGVPTPAFMPVATQGTVKAAVHEELEQMGYSLLIANTFHLAVRPGIEAIKRAGGLHRFISWPHGIATDSGGFQIMSLADRVKITDQGAVFRAPIDGKKHEFTPEHVISLQESFGSDIAMVLDECPPHPIPREILARAVERTTLWAKRSLDCRKDGIGALFGIIQGGTDRELRRKSAEEIVRLGFDGYAVGGLSVGEGREAMLETLEHTSPSLPEDRPRYLMGVGEPGDVLAAIKFGIDIFDCVFPTRVARNGLALTAKGRMPVRNAPAAAEDGPLDRGCSCPVCKRYGVSYLRHLIHAREISGMRLLTLHNLHFMRDLVGRARAAIIAGSYDKFLESNAEIWKSRKEKAGGTS